MDYLSVAEARGRSGLRLVLSAHVPGPWGESAKALFAARGVPYLPVAQTVFDSNDALRAWTGRRDAPVAMLDDEPPVSGWLDLVMLAERLGAGPSLLPAGSDERARAIGLSAEICAPYGFGWSRRLIMMEGLVGPGEVPPHMVEICRDYGYSAATAATARARVVDILGALAAQVRRQRDVGSDYLVGDALSPCDIHWACFSNMVAPLPPEDAPMPPAVYERYGTIDAEIAAALDSALIAHRDLIYRRHIGLPLDF